MRITRIAGKKVAIGLQWEILDMERLNASKKEIALQAGCKYGIVVKNEAAMTAVDDVNATPNAVVGLADEKTNLPSGAAWLASVTSSVILITPLDNGEYWLCVIQDSMPLPDYDYIGVEEEIVTRVQNTLKYHKDMPLSCSEDIAHRFIDSNPNLSTTQDFAVLIAAEPRPAKIDLLYGIKPLYLAIGIIAVVGCAGAAGYKHMDEIKKSAAMQQLQAMTDMQNKQKMEQDRAAAAAANSKALADKIQSGLNTPDPVATAKALYAFTQTLPVEHHNWKATTIECTVGAQCKWVYTRLKGGTIKDIAAYTQPTDMLRGNSAELIRPAPAQPLRTGDLRTLPTDLDFSLEFGTVLQKMESLGAAFSYMALDQGTPAPEVVQPAVTAMGVPAEPQTLPFKRGKWALASQDFANFDVYANALNYPNLTVDKLIIKNIQFTPEFSLEGSYVVR